MIGDDPENSFFFWPIPISISHYCLLCESLREKCFHHGSYQMMKNYSLGVQALFFGSYAFLFGSIRMYFKCNFVTFLFRFTYMVCVLLFYWGLGYVVKGLLCMVQFLDAPYLSGNLGRFKRNRLFNLLHLHGIMSH